MNNVALLATAFYKLASDDEESRILADMKQRLEKFKGENAPKGLPAACSNTDETDFLYPTDHNTPKDKGWAASNIITGSGGGPKL